MAAAQEVRMRADRAHLARGMRAEAFADHRRQPSVLVDAEIAPELHRARAEIVRVHQRDQLQHVVAVAFVEFEDIRAIDDGERFLAHHLREVGERFQPPARRHARRRDAEQQHLVACGHERIEGIADVGIRARDAEEGGDIGGIARDFAPAQGDIAMQAVQRREERIVEAVAGSGRNHGRFPLRRDYRRVQPGPA